MTSPSYTSMNSAPYSIISGLALLIYHAFYDLRIHGLDENWFEGPGLVASNHVSFFDPPLVGSVTPRPIYFFARNTLYKPPVLDKVLPLLNTIPIDRDKPDAAGVRKLIKTVRGGQKVLVFPEKTRSETGELQKAMPGVGFILAKCRVPILPVRIFGAYEAWPKGGPIRPFRQIDVVFGPKVEFDLPAKPNAQDYQHASDQTMEAIAKLERP